MLKNMKTCYFSFIFIALFIFQFPDVYSSPLPAFNFNPQSEASGMEVHLGGVLALREFDLKESVDIKVFEQFIINEFNPAWENHVPGAHLVIMKGDRGNREGRYLALYNFDTLERRNYYFPVADADAYPVVEKAMEPILPVINKFQEFISSDGSYTDYVVTGWEEIANMPNIQLLGIHHIKVIPGLEDKFEDFITNRWNHVNQVEDIPGMFGFFLRGDRGVDSGGYIWVSAFEPGEMRDGYFPEPGTPSEAWEQAVIPLQDLLDEINSYLTIKPGKEGFYTDYVIIK